jgi:hypothetical protein
MKALRKDNPSSIFYWKDYENDEGLRVSSLAAQGLWMRLLCVAAKSDPYGYVLINGCEIGVTGVARLCGVSETEAATLLNELERNGVFSRDRKGRIFSRRMTKEKATREKARKNGAKGGNPRLSVSHGKEKEKLGSVNQEDNPPVKPPYPLPHSPEEERRTEAKASVVLPAKIEDRSQACADHFNAVAARVGWPQVQRLTPSRKAALAQRIADIGGEEAWRDAIDRAARSPLLTGQTGRGWRADFDWLCKAANFTKLCEGNYDPPSGNPANPRRSGMADAFAAVAAARSGRA